MFGKTKRRFFVPNDDSGPVVTYDYDQIRTLIRNRRMKSIKTWVFVIVVAIVLIQALTSVVQGDISLFRTETIVAMAVCGAIGVVQAYRAERRHVWVFIINAVAVACYAVGTLLVIPLLFQHSDLFRAAMASVTGHESYNGSTGIVGASPWYVSLFALGIVGFLVYGLMVIAIVASLSSLMHVGDDKYIGDKPKKPKRKKLVVKRQDDETKSQFDERKQLEANDYAKEVKSAEWYYRLETVLWRYRKIVATGFAPIWLSLIAVACSALYISESYFNAIF